MRATEITVELTSIHQSHLNNLNISSQSDDLTVTEPSQTKNASGHIGYIDDVETEKNETSLDKEESLPKPLPCLATSNSEEGGISNEGDIPLISVTKISPSGIMLTIKPSTFEPNTQLKISYSRVVGGDESSVEYTEYVTMKEPEQSHGLYQLEEGLYLVCGETYRGNMVLQTGCVQTRLDAMESKKVLPGGLIAAIVIASIIIFLVFIYAIL